MLRELGGIEIGIGTLQATNARVANAVKPAVEALWKWAPLQPSIHVDETPWCVKGVKEWGVAGLRYDKRERAIFISLDRND